MRCQRAFLHHCIVIVSLHLVCAFFAAVPASAQSWTLAWSDEFNGPAMSQPNPANWAFDQGLTPDGQQGYACLWQEADHGCNPGNPNVYVDGKGHLVIQALSAPSAPNGITTGRLQSATGVLGSNTQSGATKILQGFQYGMIEASIAVPAGPGNQGVWPAFWMLGTDFSQLSWPASGEVDIMEYIGAADPTQIWGTPHGFGYIGSGLPVQDNNASGWAGFHTYGITWSPNHIQWWIDDPTNVYSDFTAAGLMASQQWYWPNDVEWPFNLPFYLLLDLNMGGGFPGNVTSTTTYPQQMLVDWVRVYQSEPPLPPSNVKATASSATQVKLNWTASASANITYNVYRSMTSGFTPSAQVSASLGNKTLIANNVTATSYTDSNLTPGASYYYIVSASGNYSGEPMTRNTAVTTPSSGLVGLNGGAVYYTAGGYVGDGIYASNSVGSGGFVTTWPGATFNTNGVSNAAPTDLYRSERLGNQMYAIGNLTPGASYNVRLHVMESNFTGPALRQFNVLIDGQQVLANVDPYALANGRNALATQDINTVADSNGEIIVELREGDFDQPELRAIDVTPSTGGIAYGVSPGASTYVAYNSGGEASGAFQADENFGTSIPIEESISAQAGPQNSDPSSYGGTPVADVDTNGNLIAVSTAGVTNPAPETVYQTQRWGDSGYAFRGLLPNTLYAIRLHFVEMNPTVIAPGERLFDISVNGTRVLVNYDIFAAAGALNQAVVKTLFGRSDEHGMMTVQLITGAVSIPTLQAIEVAEATGTLVPIAVPNVVGDKQAAATATIAAAGLTVGAVSAQASTRVPSGDVISESPAAGTSVVGGSAVNLVVSSGSTSGNLITLGWPTPQVTMITGEAVNAYGTESAPSGAQVSVSIQNTQTGLWLQTQGTYAATQTWFSASIQDSKGDWIYPYTPNATGSFLMVAEVTSGTTTQTASSTFNVIGPQAPVPNVVGDTEAAAASALAAGGFVLGAVTVQSSSVPAGAVITQTPAGGSSASTGSSVALVVSGGITVPNVINDSVTNAASAIKAAGFTLGTVTQQPNCTVAIGNVISESPAANSSLTRGSAVNLTVASGLPAGGCAGGTFPMIIANGTNGAWADSDIWVTAIGQTLNGNWAYLSPDGGIHNVSAAMANAPGHLTYNGVNYPAMSYNAASFNGIFTMPGYFGGGRVYLSLGAPLYLAIPADNSAIALPVAQSPSDPNYNTTWDYYEFTFWNGVVNFGGDSSQVDGFGFPIDVQVIQDETGFNRSTSYLATRDSIRNLFTNSGNPDVAGLVINSHHVLSPYNSAAFLASPTAAAFKTYIDTVWTSWQKGFNLELPGITAIGSVESDNVLHFTWNGTAGTLSEPSAADIYGCTNTITAGTPIDEALGAQICSAFHRGVAQSAAEWWEPNYYYRNAATNENPYARIIHSVTADHFAYAEPYDDANAQSSIIIAPNADPITSLTLTVAWNGPSAQITVPNVVGDTQAAATAAITSDGLTAGSITTQASSTVPSGTVISESPTAGTSVAGGSAVSLVVSRGSAQVTVPNVVGNTQAAATTAIAGAGLSAGSITTQASSTVPSGTVISESPAAGTSVASGSAVTLVVSSGSTATVSITMAWPTPQVTMVVGEALNAYGSSTGGSSAVVSCSVQNTSTGLWLQNGGSYAATQTWLAAPIYDSTGDWRYPYTPNAAGSFLMACRIAVGNASATASSTYNVQQ